MARSLSVMTWSELWLNWSLSWEYSKYTGTFCLKAMYLANPPTGMFLRGRKTTENSNADMRELEQLHTES